MIVGLVVFVASHAITAAVAGVRLAFGFDDPEHGESLQRLLVVSGAVGSDRWAGRRCQNPTESLALYPSPRASRKPLVWSSE